MKNNRSQSGQAPLVIILMAAAFTIASWVLINTYTSVESNIDIRNQDEKLQIEQTLIDTVDCAKTLEGLDLTAPNALDTKCTTAVGIQNDTYFTPMVNSDGDGVTLNYDTTKGYGDIGGWSFRAGCFRSGSTACLLVHAAKPWRGALPTEEQFKNRAMLNIKEDWKKLPNSPWPNCCFGPPSCTLTIDRNPLAHGNVGTLFLTQTGATSATITTTDPLVLPAGTNFPLSPGYISVTHASNGTYTATATVTGPAGTSTCGVTYDVVDPPYCTLDITSPANHFVTLGQMGTLALTWTNNAQVSATPAWAGLVSYHFTGGVETQTPYIYPMSLPTSAFPTTNAYVYPPVGKTDQKQTGYRVYYRAQISSAAGSSFCNSPEFLMCPLNTQVGFYSYQDTGDYSCTTCDFSDGSIPANGLTYQSMLHGFTVASNNSYVPNLATISSNYSSGFVDTWTGRTHFGGVGYDSQVPRFYAYAANDEAHNLVSVAQWRRETGNPRQDVFLFPEGYPAMETVFTANSYTKFPDEFYACPWAGNYVANIPGPGPGPSVPGPSGPTSPGPSSPGPSSPGPTAPGPTSPGPTSPGPTSPGPSSPGPSGPSSGYCRGSEPVVYEPSISACGTTQGCVGVSTMQELWDSVCDRASCIYLKNNLVGTDVKWTCGCSSPMAPRTLDGKGYSIVDFNGNQYTGSTLATWQASLFEYTETGTTRFCNLTMQNVNLTANVPSWNGMLSGFIDTVNNGTFYGDNLHVTGTIGPAKMVAGLVGSGGITSGGGTVRLTNSTVNANLIGNVVGGAIATARGGAIFVDGVDVYSNITINGGQVSGWTQLSSGGVVGDANFGGTAATININNSHYYGTMTISPGTSTVAAYGGLLGFESSQTVTITNSGFSGVITGGTVQSVGGIAGSAGCRTTLTNVSSTGSISSPNADNVGGIFGEQHANVLKNYTNVTSSTSVLGKNCSGSAYGQAKTIDNHTGVAATGSASGGSSNAVNGNTGCAPVPALVCP